MRVVCVLFVFLLCGSYAHATGAAVFAERYGNIVPVIWQPAPEPQVQPPLETPKGIEAGPAEGEPHEPDGGPEQKNAPLGNDDTAVQHAIDDLHGSVNAVPAHKEKAGQAAPAALGHESNEPAQSEEPAEPGAGNAEPGSVGKENLLPAAPGKKDLVQEEPQVPRPPITSPGFWQFSLPEKKE